MEQATINLLKDAIKELNKESKIHSLNAAIADRLVIHKNTWFNQVIVKFYEAYDDAFDAFQDALTQRKKAEQENAQLAYFALSLLGGSVISALLSRVDLIKRFDDQILNTLAKRNLDRTFDAYAAVRGSPAAEFILNQSVHKVNTWATNLVTKSLQDVDEYSISFKPKKATQLKTDMKAMYRNAETSVRLSFLGIIENNKGLSADKRIEALRKILHGSFCRIPVGPVYPKREVLAKKILLTFYLKMIVNSDSMVHTQTYVGGGSPYPTTANMGSTPILTSASSKKYPVSKSTMSNSLGTVTTDSYDVEYADLGKNIVKDLNDLYKDKKIWPGADGTNLIDGGFLRYKSNRKVNERAEYVLSQMNQDIIDFVKKRVPRLVI